MGRMLATSSMHSHVDAAASECSARIGALVFVKQMIRSFVCDRHGRLLLKFSFVWPGATKPTRIQTMAPTPKNWARVPHRNEEGERSCATAARLPSESWVFSEFRL